MWDWLSLDQIVAVDSQDKYVKTFGFLGLSILGLGWRENEVIGVYCMDSQVFINMTAWG